MIQRVFILFMLLAESWVLFGTTIADAAPPTEGQTKQCEEKARERVDRRKQQMREMTGRNDWDDNESMMAKDSAFLYLESINRLDLKYPCAVPQAEKEYLEVVTHLHHLDISKRGAHAEAKRDAAFRYLDQPKAADPVGSGLNNREVLSLAWAAIQDKTVFPSQQDMEDRTWGLLESLANIQRAHNDCPVTGAINWHEGEDKISCEVGRFKRLLEHLDKLHPDIHLNPTIAKIPVQMIIHAVRQELQRLRGKMSLDECYQIKASSQSSDQSKYQKFLNRLIREVHSSNPYIPIDIIQEQTGPEMMEAVFETPEWEQCHASSSQPSQGQPSQGQPPQDQNRNLVTLFNYLMGVVHEVVYGPVLGSNSRKAPNGLIWSDKLTTSGQVVRKNQRDAFEECLTKNPPAERAAIRAALEAGRRPTRGIFLPRQEDWEEIRIEDFPNLRGYWFWSSSVSPHRPDNAYFFGGYHGLIDSGNRDDPKAVVCVGVL